jgi:CheY-like chemotaxis protein
MVLEDMGYDVAEATDGPGALAYLRGTPRRTVVLLDLLLPDMTGVEVLEAVARDPRLSYAHAYLLMTGQHRALPECAHPLLAALGVPVVYKPFDLDTLFEVVARLAAGRSADAVCAT